MARTFWKNNEIVFGEISSKFASADFKNFCWLVSKKVPFFSA